MPPSKVAVIVGTRPEIIKMQPVVKEIEKRGSLELLFVHTGQHYDWDMSHSFIEQLELQEPDFFLNVKFGSQGAQSARIISRVEKVLKKENPRVVLVQGDTNSAMGAALAASKLKIPVGHVEAGCRSFDKNTPEEINRTLITDLASVHFAPTVNCVQNLLKEGVLKKNVCLSGHPLVDLLSEIEEKINENVAVKFGLKAKQYYLVTLHREENVDRRDVLESKLKALSTLSQHMPVFFPIHPRTKKSIKRFRLDKYLKDLLITSPLGYFETLSLIRNARIILTDSGGLQQEGALLGTPCITLRSITEWVETVDCGINFLAKSDRDIVLTVSRLENEFEEIMSRFNLAKNIFGVPPVSKKIVNILEKKFG